MVIRVHSYSYKSDLDPKESYSLKYPVDVRLITSEGRENTVEEARE